jgi:biopolymer transport protein ExbD
LEEGLILVNPPTGSVMTSRALMQQGSKVSLPSSEKGSSETAGITITATVHRTLELNGVTVERAGLHDALAKALEGREDKGVTLRGTAPSSSRTPWSS